MSQPSRNIQINADKRSHAVGGGVAVRRRGRSAGVREPPATDPEGYATYYEYDTRGQLAKVRIPVTPTHTDRGFEVLLFDYDAEGNMVRKDHLFGDNVSDPGDLALAGSW